MLFWFLTVGADCYGQNLVALAQRLLTPGGTHLYLSCLVGCLYGLGPAFERIGNTYIYIYCWQTVCLPSGLVGYTRPGPGPGHHGLDVHIYIYIYIYIYVCVRLRGVSKFANCHLERTYVGIDQQTSPTGRICGGRF